MIKKWLALLFIILALIGFEQNGQALETAEPDMGQPNHELEKMVITGTKTSRPMSEVPVSLSVITPEEIKRSAPATVGDLFRDIPGVDIHDMGAIPGQKRIVIRGESSSRVLLLVDGQKISEQKSMDGSALLMDINNIERIEIIKGPASVLYGSEGMAGVVNVITKKEGSEPVQFEASSAFNSNTDGWSNYASIFGGGESLKGFGYRLTAANNDHGNQHGADRETIDHTNYHNKEFNGYLSYTYKNFKTGISLSNYRSTTNAFLWEITPYDLSAPPDGWSPSTNIGGDAFWKFNNMELPQWDRDKQSLFFEWERISRVLSKIRIDAYRQNTFKKFIAEPFVAPGGWYPDNNAWMDTETNRYSFVNFEINTDNDQDSEGITFQSDWLFFNRHYVILGAEYHKDELDALNTTTYRPGSMISISSYGVKKVWVEAERENQDIYIQDEWNIADGWLATFGFRYSRTESTRDYYHKMHQHAHDPVLYPIYFFGRNDLEDINYDKKSTTDYTNNYAISLINNSFDNLTFRVHYGTAHTLPTLSQLFIWSSQSGLTTAPNPNLEPETAEGFEIGARYQTDSWNLDLTIYKFMAEDYITNVPVEHLEGAARQYQNIHKVETWGVEFDLSYTFQPWQITPYAVGYYIVREFDYGDYKTKDTGQPLLQGRFGVRYEQEFARSSRFWADLYGRAAQDSKDVWEDGSEDNLVPGWAIANLALGLEQISLSPWKGELNLVVECRNIFDRDYIQANQHNFPSPGRHFVLKAIMDF